MGNLTMAIAAIQTQIETLLANAYTSGQTTKTGQLYVGWPTSTELAKVLGQNTGKSQISLFPGPGRNVTRYRPEPIKISNPSPGTTAVIGTNGTQITIGGIPKAGDVIHAFFNKPLLDANYLVLVSDTTQSIALEIATNVNAYAAPGITASATGSVVTIAGSTFSKVNVGGTANMSREVTRVERNLSIDVWSPDPDTRSEVGDLIIANVGTSYTAFIPMQDSSGLRVRQTGADRWIDKAESSYTTFRWTIPVEIEYGITQSLTGTQVEGVKIIEVVNNNPPVTIYTGGP